MRRLLSCSLVFSALALLSLSLWPADTLARKPCGNSEAQKQASSLLPVLGSLGHAFSSDNCQSIVAVFEQLTRGKVRGGRQLHDAPQDPVEAEAERQAALSDPEFARALKSETAGESDPVRMQLIEAALLHDFRHYKARDLILRRLLAAQGG